MKEKLKMTTTQTKKTRKSGAGRKPLTAEEKAQRKEERELKKALEVLEKHGLQALSTDDVNEPQPETVSKPEPTPENIAVPPKPIRNLPEDAYHYRYVMNTCIAGAIHIGDIGMFVEVDENFQKVVRFTEEDFAKSRELGTHIAKGNLIDVTSEYLNFLERGNSPDQWVLWFRPTTVRMESTNFYPHRPRVRQDMIDQPDSPIVDEDDISRVHGTSDQQAHMIATRQNFRPGAEIHNVEDVLDAMDANSNPIANENVADRSNPASFVDPRMSMAKKMPNSPEVHMMRSGQMALSNQKELYPYTTDHHELTMIAQNANQPYTHVPQRVNPDQPIYEAIPQNMYQPPAQQGPQMQTMSQQQAKALFQQKMQQHGPGVAQPTNSPQLSPGAQQLLNR